MNYQALLPVPFCTLGIRCENETLTAIEFLPAGVMSPRNTFAELVCEQLLRYFENPDTPFSIPLTAIPDLTLTRTEHMQHRTNVTVFPTAHQLKVWQAIRHIPRGQTRRYGELATTLHSSAQAVGQACGANRIPIIIPCHRVVSKIGLGGFMNSSNETTLNIKRWLLSHEGVPTLPVL
jgi:methylated-DNA-[protein]-cysteine S-methyltransferase